MRARGNDGPGEVVKFGGRVVYHPGIGISGIVDAGSFSAPSSRAASSKATRAYHPRGYSDVIKVGVHHQFLWMDIYNVSFLRLILSGLIK